MKSTVGILVIDYPLAKYWIIDLKGWESIQVITEHLLWWPTRDVEKLSNKITNEYKLTDNILQVIEVDKHREKILKYAIKHEKLKSINRSVYLFSTLGYIGDSVSATVATVEQSVKLRNYSFEADDVFSLTGKQHGLTDGNRRVANDSLRNITIYPHIKQVDQSGYATLSGVLRTIIERVLAKEVDITKAHDMADLGFICGDFLLDKNDKTALAVDVIEENGKWMKELRTRSDFSACVYACNDLIFAYALEEAGITDVNISVWDEVLNYVGLFYGKTRAEAGSEIGYVQVSNVSSQKKYPIKAGEVLFVPLGTEVHCQTVFGSRVNSSIDKGAVMSGTLMIDAREPQDLFRRVYCPY